MLFRSDVVTGDVHLYSTSDAADDSFPLQIVPVVTDAQIESVASDGTSMTVLLSGFGFQEGDAGRYVFGSTTVADTGNNANVFDRYDSALGMTVQNGTVRVTVSLTEDSGALTGAAFGAISATTAGGTSAAFTRSIASIASTAFSGTPADPTKASANPGQAITLLGSGLSTDTDVLVRYVDAIGKVQVLDLKPTTAAADGTRATLVLPNYAYGYQTVNGAFELWTLGSSSQPLLQIVPVLTSWSLDLYGVTALKGFGLAEGATTFTFPGGTATDTDATDSPSYYGSGIDIDALGARLGGTGLPRHGVGAVTVTTAGGTSAPIAIGATYGLPWSIGGIAVNPDGKQIGRAHV